MDQCIASNDEEIIIDEFIDKLEILSDEFKKKMPKIPMAACLIKFASIVACEANEEHFYTIGILNMMLNSGLSELWHSHNEVEEEE